MKIIKKNKGILFWVTGLPGSGKTTLAKSIYPFIKKKYGATLILSGDDLRKIFQFKSFSIKKRLIYASYYSKFCKLLTDKNINVILATVSLFNSIRSWNRKNIDNYLEIYIETDINKLFEQKKKFFYKIKSKNVMGKNLKAEFPKNPDIRVKNNFDRSIKQLSKIIIKKITR